MFKHYTKASLSFSSGTHAAVNMADSVENAGSWTVCGSKEAMEVPNVKDLQKLGVQNIVQYSTANVCFLCFLPPTFTSSTLSAMFIGACGLPEKLSLTLVPCLYILHMIVKFTYIKITL